MWPSPMKARNKHHRGAASRRPRTGQGDRFSRGEGRILRKRAEQDHRALPLLLGRIDIDRLDQRAGDLHGLRPGGLLVEELSEPCDLRAVELGEFRVNVGLHEIPGLAIYSVSANDLTGFGK